MIDVADEETYGHKKKLIIIINNKISINLPLLFYHIYVYRYISRRTLYAFNQLKLKIKTNFIVIVPIKCSFKYLVNISRPCGYSFLNYNDIKKKSIWSKTGVTRTSPFYRCFFFISVFSYFLVKT